MTVPLTHCTFTPKVTLSEIHAAVPKHLYQKSTIKGLYYVMRDIFCALLVYKMAKQVDPLCRYLVWTFGCHPIAANFIKCILWMAYWSLQGIIWAGVWCLGSCMFLIIRKVY
jgi:hypothetical protein